MKYLIVGSGGTGSAIGSFLVSSGFDVAFIARGETLEYLKANGLKMKSGVKGEFEIKGIKAFSAEEYAETPDVIFICVKSYSVNDILPLIEKACHENTIIIPVMNGYNMGEKIASKISKGYVLGGCIYISAFIDGLGSAVQLGKLFKVAFGNRKGFNLHLDTIKMIESDLKSAGIEPILSENIEKETFKKFSFIASYATCGVYYDINAGEMQTNKEYREAFSDISNEIVKLGEALGISYEFDLTEANLKILDSMPAETTASIQKDIAQGKKTEHEGLIFEVVDIAEKLGVEIPEYRKMADKLRGSDFF
jgi:2-dehydropantoate 2-reductase